MVFGEPDVEIKKQKDGQIMVEIKGVDVYYPTTGQIRSASTIARTFPTTPTCSRRHCLLVHRQ